MALTTDHTLKRLRFRNGPLLIQLDREARNFLLDSVRLRIGEHSPRRLANRNVIPK